VISVVPCLIGPVYARSWLPSRAASHTRAIEFNADSQRGDGIAKVVLEKSHGYPPVAIGLFGIYNITNDVSTRIRSRCREGPQILHLERRGM
jgi:hypothetical protein